MYSPQVWLQPLLLKLVQLLQLLTSYSCCCSVAVVTGADAAVAAAANEVQVTAADYSARAVEV
jgi:hypothetical protein